MINVTERFKSSSNFELFRIIERKNNYLSKAAAATETEAIVNA